MQIIAVVLRADISIWRLTPTAPSSIGIAVSVPICVAVPRSRWETLVHVDVAIVVETVAYFLGANVDCAVRVIAIIAGREIAVGRIASEHRHLRVAMPVAVDVCIPDDCVDRAIVAYTVAIVIDIITDLDRAGMHAGSGVIAVIVFRGEAGRRCAPRAGDPFGISVTIRVEVSVEDIGAARTLVRT